LGDALLEIDAKVKYTVTETCEINNIKYNINSQIEDNNNTKIEHRTRVNESLEIVMLSHEAYEKPNESLSLADCAGRVTAEYVFLYPPGIPLLVPGERISKKLVAEILGYKESGLSVQGMKDRDGEFLKVVVEK